MGTTSLISSAAVAVAIVAAGGFAYLNRDCDTCIISSMMGTAQTKTVAADAASCDSGGCCPLTKSEDVLAGEADADVILVNADTAVACDEACGEACDEVCAEACEAACYDAKASDMACEEACEEACESTQEVAAGEGTESGNG